MNHLSTVWPDNNSARRQVRRGFALVELVMVMIMIGILAAMVIPKIRVGNNIVDTAARSINMSLMVAQREAVARQHNVLVVFDTAGNAARTVWDLNNNRTTDGGEKSRPFLLPEGLAFGRPSGVPELPGISATIGSGATSPKGPMLVMQRSGAADRVAVVYLTTRRAMLGSQDKDVRALYITRATGRPVWYAWTGTSWRKHQ